LVPNTDNSFSLGIASTNRWKDINISNLLNVGQLTIDPVAGAQNGSIYYNTVSNAFRGYANGAWSVLGGVGWAASSTDIYNTNSGNVGIGTTAPSGKLDVYNSSGVTSAYITNNDTTLTGQNVVQSELYLRGRYDDVANDLTYSGGAIKGFKDNTDGNGGGGLSFWTALTGAGGLSEKVRIDKAGNVGIGTTAPGAPLEIDTATGVNFQTGVRLVKNGGYVNQIYKIIIRPPLTTD
jgi:hypothetical protein